MNVPVQTVPDVRSVLPALARYTNEKLFGDLWKGPDLSPRDRSMVTLAVLIGRNQTTELSTYLNLALDHGVTPAEVSEIITHLAFYSGWSNAIAAVAVANEVFAQRGISADQLPAASPRLLPLDQHAEEQRATRVQQDVGPVSPGLVQYTGELLFHDLWLRPDLAPRDRSMVTVSALIGAGQVAQIPFHLNRAMDNGLTKEQASEVLTHVAFYAGRPNAMSAVPVVKNVFESRASCMTEISLNSGQHIEIKANGSRRSARGPVQNFTGSVMVDPLFEASEHTRAVGGLVTFEPGARTAWHTHSAGQTLIVTSGIGWVQQWGGDRQQVGPGDVIWIPPNVKHWHGGTATNRMSHIAITNLLAGSNVLTGDWLEKVSDEEYAGQHRG